MFPDIGYARDARREDDRQVADSRRITRGRSTPRSERDAVVAGLVRLAALVSLNPNRAIRHRAARTNASGVA